MPELLPSHVTLDKLLNLFASWSSQLQSVDVVGSISWGFMKRCGIDGRRLEQSLAPGLAVVILFLFIFLYVNKAQNISALCVQVCVVSACVYG